MCSYSPVLTVLRASTHQNNLDTRPVKTSFSHHTSLLPNQLRLKKAGFLFPCVELQIMLRSQPRRRQPCAHTQNVPLGLPFRSHSIQNHLSVFFFFAPWSRATLLLLAKPSQSRKGGKTYSDCLERPNKPLPVCSRMVLALSQPQPSPVLDSEAPPELLGHSELFGNHSLAHQLGAMVMKKVGTFPALQNTHFSRIIQLSLQVMYRNRDQEHKYVF